ncbi:MAG: ATP-binding protein [bacterium]
MIISFASGKGGTGKTTVATSYALLLATEYNHNIQFLDCDVEEPNAAIFLKPQIEETVSVGIPVPVVDFEKCNYCGLCAEICAYNAIAVLNPTVNSAKQKDIDPDDISKSTVCTKAKNDVLIFTELCHGCGGCKLLCPKHAISETDREIGVIEKGKSGAIEFMQGKLNIGEPMATPLIRQMKKSINPGDEQLTLIDVSPGTSCPVVEAVKGSDFTVLVTEPTPFGLNDLILAVETLKKLAIPMGIVINRSSGDDKIITDYCEKAEVPVLVKVPLAREIAVAYSKGEPFINLKESYKQKFIKLHQKITELLGGV